MKKLVLALGLFAFVAFGFVSVQNVVAATNGIEIVDKDPAKDNDKSKKDAKTAEVKAGDKSCATKSSCCGGGAKVAKADDGCCESKSTMASGEDCCKDKGSTKMAAKEDPNKR
jgi:hypothetical protein